jgi:radical SAM family protein
MRVVLISTYDLGRQPFGLASPAAWLREAGADVVCVDVSRAKLPVDDVRAADLVAWFLPMHTATRLALDVIDHVRRVNPSAHLCAYGLYAPLNADVLRAHGVETILGAEFEEELVRVASLPSRGSGGFRLQTEVAEGFNPADPLPHLQFRVPDRRGLPSLAKYAGLQDGDRLKVAGYTEASRGCKHRCRHCPIVPVYDGRFRAIPVDVVLADIRAQVAAGAEHITFGDPDFFNGPRHAGAIVDALHREWPTVSYDVTIKIEHLRQHRDLLPRLRETGCAFVTSAVESIDDRVLAMLEKGHTRADFEWVAEECARLGLTLSPTFVAFTPWTTLDGYCELLQAIDCLALVDAVAPVQYAIRLLIPQGSRMLELPDVRAVVTHFDARWLTYAWRHADPRVDSLQRAIEALVGSRPGPPRAEVFARVWALAHERAGRTPPPRQPLTARATIPYLNEPWYC